MMRWGLIGALGAALVLAGLLVLEMRSTGNLTAENGSLRASVDVLTRRVHDARIAEAIARATMETEQARSVALAAALEQLNGGPDAPLPDHIRDLLRDLPDGL